MSREEFAESVHRGVTDIIGRAEEALVVAKVIGDCHERVNQSKYWKILGHLQLMEIDQCIVNLAKLFDAPPRNYPTRSIPAVVSTMEQAAESLPIVNRQHVEKFLIQNGLEASLVSKMSEPDLTRAFVSTYQGVLKGSIPGYEAFAKALDNVRYRRDKETAHNEEVSKAQRIQASWADLETVLKVAQEFCGVVGPAYFDFHFAANDGTYMLSRQHQEIGRSMSAMLRDLGIHC